MRFQSLFPTPCKLLTKIKAVENVNNVIFLSFIICFINNVDVVSKIDGFNLIYGTIRWRLKNKVRKDTDMNVTFDLYSSSEKCQLYVGLGLKV